MPSSYENIASEIDQNKNAFIERLRIAVAIPSISAEPEHRKDIFRMVYWTQNFMESLGIECKQIDSGEQKLQNNSTIQLPPVLFGTLGQDPKKRTLLIYGHVDVQPAKLSDGWRTEPFQLTEIDGKLFGRGSSDDKGPVLAWLNAIETMQKLKIEIPVNIKFVFEGMEEFGSIGLAEVLIKHKDTFLHDVDMVCISDNVWIGRKKPNLTYGLRGINVFTVEVSGPIQDLHSGGFGGVIYEPMDDLIWILSRLKVGRGKILIDGIYDLVKPITKDEETLYQNIDFDVESFKKEIRVNQLTYDNLKELCMYNWRFPSLSIHGIEGAFSGPGIKTVIPAKVIGKFSIRTVPNMDPEKVDKLVIDFLNKIWKERNSPNNFKPVSDHSAPAWEADFNDPNYKAGARALKKVFGVEPDFVRGGFSVPITLCFQEILNKSVMLLPIGAVDDMAHSQNEKIDVKNYIDGTKAMAAYLLELAQY